MMSFLQTGKALYVLAAICLAGIFTRLAAGSFYKRLIKESTNLALTKNKCLRALRQNAEDTYRINQGMSNTRVYLERQMYGMRMMGMSVRGLDNLSGQLTLLCFLAGGAAAFMSYWYRSDNYYIVLYGTVGILSGMLTMLFDYGINLDSRKQQLMTCLQDYMENVMLPRNGPGGNRGSRGGGSGGRAKGTHPGPLPGQRAQGRRQTGIGQTAASREKIKETIKNRTRKILVRTGCKI